MAKRKGKSQHRQQNWEQLHRDGHLTSDDADSRGRLTRRRVRLPGQRQDAAIFADDAAETPPEGKRSAGMVVQLYPGGAMVRTGDYGDLMCGLAGTFRPSRGASALAVGDQVALTLTPETQGLIRPGQQHIDRDRVDALIQQRGPRKTALSRPQPMRGKRQNPYDTELFEKVIAANMEQLVVVAAVKSPPFRRRLLDRYLIIAERGEMPLVLVINKTDLGEPDRQLLDSYAGLNVRWIACSAATGDGLDEFRNLLTGRSSILAGASGVGKSSLLNALLPELTLPTRQVRMRDDRGRHTTTAATVYDLPGGGMVVDTPGIRELGIEIDSAELPWYFPEIAELAGDCKFRNCTHTHEPECAVIEAAEDGRIPPRRFGSYLRILESTQD